MVCTQFKINATLSTLSFISVNSLRFINDKENEKVSDNIKFTFYMLLTILISLTIIFYLCKSNIGRVIAWIIVVFQMMSLLWILLLVLMFRKLLMNSKKKESTK